MALFVLLLIIWADPPLPLPPLPVTETSLPRLPPWPGPQPPAASVLARLLPNRGVVLPPLLAALLKLTKLNDDMPNDFDVGMAGYIPGEVIL